MDTPWIEVLFIVVAILANGLFAGSEIALVSARPSRLAQLESEGVRGARSALELKKAPQAFLATIQIAITLVGALASALGGAAAVQRLTPWIAELPLPGATTWAAPVALGGVILVITYVSLVLGELAPKALALRQPDRIACAVAPPLSALTRGFGGLVTVLTASTNAVLRLLGQGPPGESPFVSEEEVRYLVREGAAKGVFEKVEEELVHRAFEFADTTVREIMVPRINIVGLDIATPADQVLQRASELRHSRLPVFRDSIETPLGVVEVRDLLRASAEGRPIALAGLLRPPLFVPESARISAVLREFQRRRQYLALVVDEYGGVVGLVTIEDLLEEIVGEIRETGEGIPEYVTRLADGAYLLAGTAPVRELREALGLPIPESADYTTVAGFIIATLRTIPIPGMTVSHGGFLWTVIDMEGPRVVKVKVQREAPGS